ncbi:uncharacterized protein LOC121978333 [Zingiber officinale]|uniref:uncharacterized protein LOC121978333 n=1 Tax=Zingiber officinale TaxID=94328 RepID=UPI001C4C95F6|nr:uncharacterized protein LOC121978333 [Zingiber officinale]
MVGGGSRRHDGPLKINSTNVFAVLETLKKKKKSDKESKSKGASKSQGKEQEKQVFWALAPLPLLFIAEKDYPFCMIRDACEITVVHQEDAGLNVEMAKLTFAKGIWSFVSKTNSALRGYSSHPSRSVLVPALLRLIKKCGLLRPTLYHIVFWPVCGSALVPSFWCLQGLHNIHGSFNLPTVPGSLASRDVAMGVVPSGGVQQPGGSIPSGRFSSNNLLVALSQMPHGSGVTNRGGINVVGNHAFSSSNINGVTGSITGISSSSAYGNRSSVPGLGVSPVLSNVGPRLTSSVGNIVGSGNMGRSISSGGLSVLGLASRVNLAIMHRARRIMLAQ